MLENRSTVVFVIIFICLWVLAEIIRSTLFTGFPWLVLGYSLTKWNTAIQSASVWGVYGLSFIVLSLASVPFILFNARINHEKLRLPLIVATVFVAFFVMNYLYGVYRLQHSDTKPSNFNIRLVQPNINQSVKWDPKLQSSNLQHIMKLTVQPYDVIPKYIVWPEAATASYLLSDIGLREVVKSVIPEDSYLILGGIRGDRKRVWSSMFVLNHKGTIVDYYDKQHLVPFGEYIPFRKWLPFDVNKITYGTMDYTPGQSSKIIKIDSLPAFRPLICYESFFPQELIVNGANPDAFINITNDGWYGDSPGPYQHLDMSVLRAVEYGIPLVRVANTGVSVATDSYGRILQKLALNEAGLIDIKLPSPLEGRTVYSFCKDYIIIGMILMLLFLLIFRTRFQA